MPIESPKFEKKTESEKESQIKDVEKEVDEIADADGKPIDDGIKPAVVGLKLLEFPTNASCEGHIEQDEGIPVPWLEIQAENRPKERFIGENAAFEKVAKKYNLTIEETKKSKIPDAYWEAMRECSRNEETEEYKQWNKENKVLMKKVKSLLGEFYKDRKVEPNVKLEIKEMVRGFRIHNGGEDYVPIVAERKKLSAEEKEALSTRLTKYRAEMNDFAKFLKDKFLKE